MFICLKFLCSLVSVGARALGKRGYLIIIEGYFFLFLIETLHCDPSSEPSRRDGSDEGSQCIFVCRIKENYP